MRLCPMIRDAVLFVLPVAVLASMWSAFGWLGRRFGPRLGYFLGFLVYWLGWCLLVPLLLLGASGVRHLFRLGPHPLGQPA
ncbi:MAG TPA: hypothetical protein VK576_11520, partial [Thermoleophilia bacterium]|nr:hypothetical protein [Thermoleophilia bacterium]